MRLLAARHRRGIYISNGNGNGIISEEDGMLYCMHRTLFAVYVIWTRPPSLPPHTTAIINQLFSNITSIYNYMATVRACVCERVRHANNNNLNLTLQRQAKFPFCPLIVIFTVLFIFDEIRIICITSIKIRMPGRRYQSAQAISFLCTQFHRFTTFDWFEMAEYWTVTWFFDVTIHGRAGDNACEKYLFILF